MPKAKSFNFSAKNLIGFSLFFSYNFFILFRSFFFVLEVFTDRFLNYTFIDRHINLKIECKYHTIFNMDMLVLIILLHKRAQICYFYGEIIFFNQLPTGMKLEVEYIVNFMKINISILVHDISYSS